jgi:histidine triad (HIT) family protein
MPEKSIFSRIINREIPADIVFENDQLIVIKDIKDDYPIHLLGITKRPYRSIDELLGDETAHDLLWELYKTLARLAAEAGIAERGYRLTTNVGKEGGQVVPHLHVHLLGGTQLPV